ncbi:MFS transporter [Streptomyces sp. 1331.2]|uniref:MFS transporter n=1 Tax=Streptomyces sp. 1331.2 TaxID=1938835 RepID=UPI000BDB30EE|nr:MFS transporter [Streptomyces sp. 1331.2]SOB88728.1 Major Facilitator Superfamily protein [Streptomyces sp. 1331.2]
MLVSDDIRPPGYREVFRERDFRVLWAAHALLNLGEVMKALALSALVYSRSGSPLLSGIAYVAGLLPQVVGSAALLSLADRLPPRLTMAGWDVARAVGAGVLALDVLPVPGVLALSMLYGLFDPVPAAMKSALLPELVGERRFVPAQSLMNVTVGAAQISGFAVGGALLALLGPVGTLWVVCGGALLSAAVLRLGLRLRPPRGADEAAITPARALSRTWSVNRALWADVRVRRLLLALCLPACWIVGAEALMISYADEIGRPRSVGALLTAAAVGMLVGDVLVGRFATRRQRNRWALPLSVLLGAPYLFFAARPDIAVAAGLAALASVGFGYSLCLQEPFVSAVPVGSRGQAFGLAASGLMSCQGVAAGLTGVVAELVRPSVGIAVAAAVCLVCTALLVRVLRPRP